MKGLLFALLVPTLLHAQPPQDTPPPSSGTVVFSTDRGTPASPAAVAGSAVPEITPAERRAPTFTRYDLDIHLIPAEARITVRGNLEIRNDGTQALAYLPLQLSSTLTWESVAIAGVQAAFAQHSIDTDADHTGKANEVVVTLPKALPPGESLALSVFYSGEIHASAERLERIGAPLTQAEQADWDVIAPPLTALRGFGDVLWYPVAAEQVFLGEGAKLFQAAGEQRLRQQHATTRVRLSVQYAGDPPDAAFFCGRREHMAAIPDDPNLPLSQQTGIATAEFEAAPLGFRSPSLFVTDRAPTVTSDTLIAAVTDHYDAVPQYAAGAALVKPLLTAWLGPTPLSQLNLIDHPGQPFEDGAFVVLPMRASPAAGLAPSLVHTLAHAWFRSPEPWLDEGVAQFLTLLWTEQSEGRDAAVQALQQGANTLALAEPGDTSQAPGQPLSAARDDVYYRTKAAAVLWMLRSLAGDEPLKQALTTYGRLPQRGDNPHGFQAALEKSAHRDLAWFFDDWVYRDRGLPDLTIANVTPRELPAQGGKPAGWLVSVEVRNDGDSIADVPVTVRSGALTTTERLRIAGRSSASTRILFQTTPEEVLVNDGTVPEMRTSQHTLQIRPRS